MKDKQTYTKHKEHGEDITHENEIVIDFKQAQTDKTVDNLRNNIRDLINMNDQYKKLIADQSTKIIELEQTIKDLKKERSEYYGAS
jgi:archaellum component FlaC